MHGIKKFWILLLSFPFAAGFLHGDESSTTAVELKESQVVEKNVPQSFLSLPSEKALSPNDGKAVTSQPVELKTAQQTEVLETKSPSLSKDRAAIEIPNQIPSEDVSKPAILESKTPESKTPESTIPESKALESSSPNVPEKSKTPNAKENNSSATKIPPPAAARVSSEIAPSKMEPSKMEPSKMAPSETAPTQLAPTKLAPTEMNMSAEKKCRVSLSGEFLYWTIRAAQMDYVVERTRSKTGQVPFDGTYSTGVGTAFFGTLHEHHFKWDPGFRLGLSYETNKDAWMLSGLYTYFHSHSRSSKDPKTGPFDYLNGTLFQASDTPVHKARSLVRFTSDVAELNLARNFKVSKAISFQFLAGIIGAWTDMKWRVEFVGSTIFPNNLNWKFKGGGLNTGFKSLWNIASGLNFCLDGGLSALYGSHHNSYKSASIPNHQDAWALLYDKDLRIVWKTNLKSGFSWLKQYTSFGYELFLGVEVNTWFNLNENYRPLISTPGATSPVQNERPRFFDSCPLNIYGLSARTSFSF